MNFHVGFTGARVGMTNHQKFVIRRAFDRVVNMGVVCHHGDCVGADKDFHDLSVECNFSTIIHPPENDSMRAWCKGDIMYLPRSYIDRNRDIVEASRFLIATPQSEEVKRSGTWATIRMGRKKGIPVMIVYPDGEKVVENLFTPTTSVI